MPEPKLGVELTSLRVSVAQSLSMAAQAGVQAVEIDAQDDLFRQGFSRTGLRELRKRLDDLHLRVSVVSYRTRSSYSTIEDLEPRIAGAKVALELAYELRASAVVVPIGKIPPDSDDTGRRVLVDVLGDLGRYGNRVGATLAIGTGEDSGEAEAKLLAELPDGVVGVDLNPARLVVHGHSPLEMVSRVGRSILHVHATDAKRGDLSGGREMPLGRGDVDWPALLGALGEQNYRGDYTIAFRTATDPAAALAAAVGFLRQFLRGG